MKEGIAPELLCELTPVQTNERTAHNLRSKDNYTVFQTATTSFQKSFLPSTVVEWNKQSADVKAARTIS